MINVLLQFDLPVNGTVQEMRKRLSKHQQHVDVMYTENDFLKNTINVLDCESQPQFQAMHRTNKKTLFATSSNKRFI